MCSWWRGQRQKQRKAVWSGRPRWHKFAVNRLRPNNLCVSCHGAVKERPTDLRAVWLPWQLPQSWKRGRFFFFLPRSEDTSRQMSTLLSLWESTQLGTAVHTQGFSVTISMKDAALSYRFYLYFWRGQVKVVKSKKSKAF